MSGGSWNYVYEDVDGIANTLIYNYHDIHRKALGILMKKIAKALHDIEWTDSNDNAKGSEIPAILACISQTDIETAAIERVDQMIKELNAMRKSLQPKE